MARGQKLAVQPAVLEPERGAFPPQEELLAPEVEERQASPGPERPTMEQSGVQRALPREPEPLVSSRPAELPLVEVESVRRGAEAAPDVQPLPSAA